MESFTKIVATVGPATDTKEKVIELIEHKVDIMRLNFSWSSHEQYANTIKNIREASSLCNRNVLIMQDLSGPRIQEESGHHFGGKEDEKITTDKDIVDLSFGIEQGVDYIAQSFVGTAEDIISLKKLIEEKGGNQKIIAKIERKLAYENLDEIIRESDAIMVARGDLGNEFPLEEIPFIQHNIIKACNKANKMVIVATEMMLSMTENTRPTRAEVTDIAYAIINGANGVMLSEESAKGKHPIEAVEMMEKICLAAEKHLTDIKII